MECRAHPAAFRPSSRLPHYQYYHYYHSSSYYCCNYYTTTTTTATTTITLVVTVTAIRKALRPIQREKAIRTHAWTFSEVRTWTYERSEGERKGWLEGWSRVARYRQDLPRFMSYSLRRDTPTWRHATNAQPIPVILSLSLSRVRHP